MALVILNGLYLLAQSLCIGCVTGWDTDSILGSYSHPLATLQGEWEKVKVKEKELVCKEGKGTRIWSLNRRLNLVS